MSPIRPSVCPQDIYKTNETSSCTSSQIWHTPNNLLGRHFVYEPNSYRASAGHVNSNSFIRKPRFCNKLNKISTEANPDSRISGVYIGYQEYDTSSSPRESDSNQRPVLSDAVSNTTHCSRHSTINREANSLNSGYIPSPTTLSPVTELKKHSPSVRGNYNMKVSLNPACQEELQWWIAHLNAWNGRAILTPPPDLVIETDASQQGWGAVCRSKDRGPLVSERTTSAHQLSGTTCRGFCSEMFHKEPDLFACSPQNGQYNCHCILKQTRRDSLLSTVQSSCRALELDTQQGHDSQCPTFAREVEYPSDWHLDPSLFLALMKIQGPCQIDLFANRLNAQLPAFFSWKPDPQGLASDAFQQAWTTGRNYAFPPFCLIMKTLAKLREEGGNLILITPVWPTRPWYPVLQDMSIAPPVLPQVPKLLTNPVGDLHLLVQNKTLFLAAWHVSNNQSQQEAYRTGLTNSFWHLGDQAQIQCTVQPGVNGIAGVRRGKPQFGKYN